MVSRNTITHSEQESSNEKEKELKDEEQSTRGSIDMMTTGGAA
jgi:hypothetical protein